MATKTRKRRKMSLQISENSRKDSIFMLPENVLLEIFSYLTKKELCIACRVCRTWRRVANDNKLWRHVDMMDYPLPLAKMWKVIRAHFSDVLQTLRLSGFLAIGCATKWKRATISNAMLDELRERCPNIVELCLSHTNLNTSKGVESKRFPVNLRVLKITHSQVPCCMMWLSGGKEGTLLPNLEELDFSNSSAVNVHTLTAFGPRDQLKVLKLNGCYRLTGSLYESLFDNFPNLEILEIAETSVTDVMLHRMCRTLTKLRHLHMAQSRQVSDAGILCISSGLKNLKWLNLAHCHKVTFEGFRSLAKLELSYLSVAGNHLTEDMIKILTGAFKDCKVVHSDSHENDSDGSADGECG